MQKKPILVHFSLKISHLVTAIFSVVRKKICANKNYEWTGAKTGVPYPCHPRDWHKAYRIQ